MYSIYNILTKLVIIISPILFLIRIFNGKEDSKRFLEKFCIYKDKKKKLKQFGFMLPA